MARVLCPLPDRDFDVTEVAVPWKLLTRAGHGVVFATEAGGAAPAADPLLLTGVLFGQLGAEPEPKAFYEELSCSRELRAPIAWSAIEPDRYDALLLPGGHAKGMRQYLGSSLLHEKVAACWALGRPVAAICHGVLVLARSRDPLTGRSVLAGSRTTCLPAYMERTAYFLTAWRRGRYYRTYPAYVEEEVRAALEDPARQFVRGPIELTSRRTPSPSSISSVKKSVHAGRGQGMPPTRRASLHLMSSAVLRDLQGGARRAGGAARDRRPPEGRGDALHVLRAGSRGEPGRALPPPGPALQRLTELPDGRLLYFMKRKGPDGRTHLVLTPAELLRKLAAVVPPPRVHATRYAGLTRFCAGSPAGRGHGVFAPNAFARRRVVPAPPAPACHAPPPATGLPPPPVPGAPVLPASRVPWADLLKRTLAIDVLRCPRCDGRMRVLAYISDPDVTAGILDHLGQLPRCVVADAPELRRLRRPSVRLRQCRSVSPPR